MRILYLLALFIITGCHSNGRQAEQTQGYFEKGKALGKVAKRLEEASGLVASTRNPGMLWTHNDSGHPAEVFLIDTLGKIKMICKLDKIKSRDWEDITIGSGPEEGKNYLYVGDIGDNDAKYPFKLVYRFEEPLFDQKEKKIEVFDTLVIRLSDGVRDTEAMMIDPQTKDWFIVSKREDSVRLYKMSYPYEADTLTAEKVATLPFQKIVAANISADGNELLMKDYSNVYYWKRSNGQTISELLRQPPTVLPYEAEMQGESICFRQDGKGYYTLSESSEKKQAELMYYKRK